MKCQIVVILGLLLVSVTNAETTNVTIAGITVTPSPDQESNHIFLDVISRNYTNYQIGIVDSEDRLYECKESDTTFISEGRIIYEFNKIPLDAIVTKIRLVPTDELGNVIGLPSYMEWRNYPYDEETNLGITYYGIVVDDQYSMKQTWNADIKLTNLDTKNSTVIDPTQIIISDQFSWKYTNDYEQLTLMPGESLRVHAKFKKVSITSMPTTLNYHNISMDLRGVGNA